MRDFDFSPLFRTAIGFDRLPGLIDTALRSGGAADAYPPYNIEKLDEESYRVTVAVAGFDRSELSVEAREGVLVVGGERKPAASGSSFLHRGIAGRSFVRRFQIAEHVEARGAALVNGLLTIDLVREVPEALKPRRIEIGGAPAATIETREAA